MARVEWCFLVDLGLGGDGFGGEEKGEIMSEKLIERFTALNENNKDHKITILVFQESSNSVATRGNPNGSIKSIKCYVTSDNQLVKCIDDNTFELIATEEIFKRVQ